MSKKIPRVIIQSFGPPVDKLTHLKTHIMSNVLICTKRGWKYEYYDDEDCRNFLRNYCSVKTQKAYNALPIGAARADLFRYCVLYHKGGVWTDVHFRLINLTIRPESEMVLQVHFGGNCKSLGIGVIGTHAKNPIIRRAIDKCVSNVADLKGSLRGYDIWNVTGPNMFHSVFSIAKPNIAKMIEKKEDLERVKNIDVIQEMLKPKTRRYECYQYNIHTQTFFAINHVEEYEVERKRLKMKHYTEM